MLTFSYSCIQHYFGKRGGEGEETEKHLTILPTHEEASQSHTKPSRHETLQSTGSPRARGSEDTVLDPLEAPLRPWALPPSPFYIPELESGSLSL